MSTRSCLSYSQHSIELPRRTGTSRIELSLYMHILIICRTILGLVYNALKLCMEMNPELFDECVSRYRQQRQMYV